MCDLNAAFLYNDVTGTPTDGLESVCCDGEYAEKNPSSFRPNNDVSFSGKLEGKGCLWEACSTVSINSVNLDDDQDLALSSCDQDLALSGCDHSMSAENAISEESSSVTKATLSAGFKNNLRVEERSVYDSTHSSENWSDLADGSSTTTHTGHCVEPCAATCVPSISRENIYVSQQQKKVVKRGKRRKAKYANMKVSRNCKLQSNKAVSKADGSIATADCVVIVDRVVLPGSDIAECDVVTEPPETALCLPCVTEDVPTCKEFAVEDNFDDIGTFTVVNRRSTRRRNSIQLFRESLHNAKNSPEGEENFEVIPACVTTENDGTGDEVENNPAFNRRSYRRRNSIQLFRQSLHNAENCAEDEEKYEVIEACGTTENDATGGDVHKNPANYNSSVCDETFLTTESQTTAPLPINAEEKVDPESDGANLSRPKRRCTTPSNTAVNVRQVQSVKTRRTPASSIEDIYRNRLWRSQMPKPRTFEPIPESPMFDRRSGTEKFFASRKVHCLTKFDDIPTKTRLRQRRQKAVARGWKPITKKRLEVLDGQLACKLSELDSELIEVNGSDDM